MQKKAWIVIRVFENCAPLRHQSKFPSCFYKEETYGSLAGCALIEVPVKHRFALPKIWPGRNV